ncbi:MAG: 30S ribosomal protein S4 [bacterium]|nr:30S ribosomal protein S4 [bacterium]
MARNLKPKCKQCRRIGESVCGTEKCAVIRRNYPPGQHGNARRRRLTEYGLQLREKQKAKILYGILEKQFRNYYLKSSNKSGNTGDILLNTLEKRFDNVVYRAGLGSTRRQARQLVTHAHFLVNGKPCNVPSRDMKAGDVIELKESSQKSRYFLELPANIKMHEAPGWIDVDKEKFILKIVADPTNADVEQGIAVNLIVEYYSR